MTIIKKLDLYILKKFLLIFAGAFFVVLFVFMMQFTWRYVDELIGKGLSLDILAKFYWYMAITLVQQALPLSILLTSLITFGNMGESFELLAMKAAGVPLIRIMRPLALFALFATGASFYFQNDASPKAQMELRTLLFSMKEQSPAVEIPEGVFYNGVPNINIFVQRKNTETGMLYQTIIYKTDQGFDHAQIVLADSARLEITRDKLHLKLDLWNGEQFESLESTGSNNMMGNGAHEPFDRETFLYKTLLIDFDSNFNLMDKNMLAGMPSAKNMRQIEQSVDSMNAELDSVGRQSYKEASAIYYKRPRLEAKDSIALLKMWQAHAAKKTLNFDTLTSKVGATRMQMAKQQALGNARSIVSDLDWKGTNTELEERNIRNHWVEWHNKFTYSLACLLFFFIGAPLGAIIRKGGLGMPTVISVAIFIVWYIIYTSGMKMARDGSVNMVLGMWISSIIIAPFGVFFTYKANKDSVVFNTDAYRNFFNRLFALRTHRHIYRKEVIIDDPRLDILPGEIEALKQSCIQYGERKKLLLAPSYINTFFRYTPDLEVEEINDRMEAIVDELSNSRNRLVLGELNRMPIIFVYQHTTPFHSKALNIAAGVIFPIGLVLWIRIWRFRLRLYRDMRTIIRTCNHLQTLIQDGTLTEDEDAESTKKVLNGNNWHTNKKWLIALIIALAVCGSGYWGWNAWKQYRIKRYIQEHGELTPNTPKDMENNATINFENAGSGPTPIRQLKLPEKAPDAGAQ